jgi:hypothetical protein
MKQVTIKCPECNHEFSPDQSLKHQLDHMMKDERIKLQEEIKQKEEDLKKKELSISELVQVELEKERNTLQKQVAEKARLEVDAELTLLKAELDEKQQKLNKAKELELENERIKREASERETNLRLDMEKEMNEKSSVLEKQIIEREADRNQMKLAERDKNLNDLKKQLEDARRKAEQGSVQSQGEIQEVVLEEQLKNVFRFDSIHEVPKGTNGADVLQTVRTQFGKECGMIAFESKRTKTFSEPWIAKLKEDMRIHGADHGIIVTEAMPKDMPTFGIRGGVWICTFKEVGGLTAAIRQICITEAKIKDSEKNKDSKVHALYSYLISREFKQRVEGLIKSVDNMKSNVDKERKSMLAFWKKQEIEIDQMNILMMDVVGSIDGLSGNALGPINGLVLNEKNQTS